MNRKTIFIALCASILFSAFIFHQGNFDSPARTMNEPISIKACAPPDYGSWLFIDGEDDLAAAADSGSGSVGDPYVIEDHLFQADENATGNYAAYIINTVSYLIVRDCWFNGSQRPVAGDSANLYLKDASQITIQNCTFMECANTGEIIVNNCAGIEFNNCTLDTANVTTEAYGFNITSSSMVWIFYSTIDTLYVGIWSDTSQYVYIQNNIITDSFYTIISNGGDDYGVISYNTIQNAWHGCDIVSARWFSVTYNLFQDCSEAGAIAMQIAGSSGFAVSFNQIDGYGDLDYLTLEYGIKIYAASHDGIVYNNTVIDSDVGIVIATDADSINVTDNWLERCQEGIETQNYIYDIDILRNWFYNCSLGIYYTGFMQTGSRIEYNYFRMCSGEFDNSTEIDAGGTLRNNYYYEYFDSWPLDVMVSLTSTVLPHAKPLAPNVTDATPRYYGGWYEEDRNLYIAYFSNYDHFGYDGGFSMVKTFIDGVQVASASSIIQQFVFRFTVKDYADIVLHDELYNYNEGSSINLGLDIVYVTFLNNGSHTAYVTVSYEGIEFEFDLQPGTSELYRLAAGDYEIEVEDSEGNQKLLLDAEIEDSTHSNKGRITLSLGWVDVEITEEPEPVMNTVNYVLAIVFIVGLTALILFLAFQGRGGEKRSETSGIDKKFKDLKKKYQVTDF